MTTTNNTTNNNPAPLHNCQKKIITDELKQARKNVEKAAQTLRAFAAIANQCGYHDNTVAAAEGLVSQCENFNDDTRGEYDFDKATAVRFNV